MNAIVYFLCFLTAMMGTLVCDVTSGAEGEKERIKPVMVISGTDSVIESQAFFRCSSRHEWERLWSRHTGIDASKSESKCPQFDFDNYTVFALFHGSSSQNRGLDLIEILRRDDVLIVRFCPSWYQVGPSPDTSEADESRLNTSSFAFVLLAKTRERVIFEINTNRRLGEKPDWKAVAEIQETEKQKKK